MKALVISLLRVGDIFMTLPIFYAMKKNNSSNRLHLLLNSQFKGVSPLLNCIEKIHFFDRERIQRSLGDPTSSFFEAFDRVQEIVDAINAEEFDFVFNFTHTRLSGWMMGLIQCPNKIGLQLHPNNSIQFGSHWFRYLNNLPEKRAGTFSNRQSYGNHFPPGDHLHRVDILAAAVGVQTPLPHPFEIGPPLPPIDQWVTNIEDFIVVQTQTSDPKKTWDPQKYAEAIKCFLALNPSCSVVLTGSSTEKAALDSLVDRIEPHAQKNVKIALCDFQQALSLIRSSRLLITGDTSIKHLGSLTATSILEVSLGSSDFWATGAYSSHALVIQSREYCAPCRHSDPCHRPSHRCSERISPRLVGMVASHIYQKNLRGLDDLAGEFEKDCLIYSIGFSDKGLWNPNLVKGNKRLSNQNIKYGGSIAKLQEPQKFQEETQNSSCSFTKGH